jgi:tetratricopeptide (TPR) repeat protein
MRIQAVFAATFGLSLIAGGQGFADSGGASSTDRMPSCAAGEVYNSSTKKCEKQRAGLMPDEGYTNYAYSLLKSGRYTEVIGVLDLLQHPETPVALNYRGYATRKLGRVDEGIGYYLKSVALDPQYAQVREYLGEAYIVKGDMASAKAQLAAIKQICGTVCDEYQHLAVAIANPADI